MDKNAPWSAYVAIAFDALRKPSKIRSCHLISPSPFFPLPSQCREEWLKRYRTAQSVFSSNSPQEAAVARLPGPALGGSVELSQQLSKWSVASERYLKSECEMEGSTRCGWAAAARGQLPDFRLRPILLNRVEESAFEEQGHLFWACRESCWR